MMEHGITEREFDALLRLSETDPEEALKGLLDHFYVPKQKLELPVIQLDRREYNLLVAMQERQDAEGTILLLLNLLKFKHEPHFRSDQDRIMTFEMFRPSAKLKPENKIYVHAKFKNISVFDLNVMETGQLDVTPIEIYQGAVYLPYLISWIRSGFIQLLGV